ncbi:MAG: carboxylating nicotinate-nucleotide diphosphorylase [Myxococcaceae bacterium]|nr:carboxylating nicotinate-nucleotide diphosphorylase [Myxococcaceae bacterium]
MPADAYLDRLIDLALDEDLGAAGDVTTDALIDPKAQGRGELWAKEQMVLSGLVAFQRVFERFDPTVEVTLDDEDGEWVLRKRRVARLFGPLRSLLIAERTALNIVQRMSGIATMAARAAEAVKGTKLKVLDTRKTSPGMRALSKLAVRQGGAWNHRFGLFDGVLIKDNHIAAVGGSVTEALKRAHAKAPRLVKIEIEISRLEQLDDAIDGGAHVVLLDNMSDAQIAQAVKKAKGRVELEASGGVTLERLPALAKLGVDYVSLGALTHSARAMDLSLEILGPKTSR